MGTPIERVSGGRTGWTGMARIREPWESLELLLAEGRDKRAVMFVIGHFKLASRTREPMWFSVTSSIPFMPGHLQSFFSPPTAEEEREAEEAAIYSVDKTEQGKGRIIWVGRDEEINGEPNTLARQGTYLIGPRDPRGLLLPLKAVITGTMHRVFGVLFPYLPDTPSPQKGQNPEDDLTTP